LLLPASLLLLPLIEDSKIPSPQNKKIEKIE
jgi:hypothetical protein